MARKLRQVVGVVAALAIAMTPLSGPASAIPPNGCNTEWWEQNLGGGFDGCPTYNPPQQPSNGCPTGFAPRGGNACYPDPRPPTPGSAAEQFEQENQQRREEILQTEGRSGWYPGCNTMPMC